MTLVKPYLGYCYSQTEPELQARVYSLSSAFTYLSGKCRNLKQVIIVLSLLLLLFIRNL